MNEEKEALYGAVRHAHTRIAALESMLLIFLGSQSKRDPSVADLLRKMAAGDVPDMEPDMALPAGLTESERAEIAANFEQQRKMTRHYMMQTANMFAEHIRRQN